MFAARGYVATSMRDIALAVGIRPASLYHHFPSKEKILWDLTRSALDDLEAARVRAQTDLHRTPVHVRLAAFVRAHVEFHLVHGQQARLVNNNLDCLSDPRRREAIEARGVYERHLEKLLIEGRETGELSALDLKVTTYAILQMCTSVSNWFRPEGELTVADICEVHEELVLRMVQAPSKVRLPQILD